MCPPIFYAKILRINSATPSSLFVGKISSAAALQLSLALPTAALSPAQAIMSASLSAFPHEFHKMSRRRGNISAPQLPFKLRAHAFALFAFGAHILHAVQLFSVFKYIPAHIVKPAARVLHVAHIRRRAAVLHRVAQITDVSVCAAVQERLPNQVYIFNTSGSSISVSCILFPLRSCTAAPFEDIT